MGLPEKLTAYTAETLGEPVAFATMVVPPGATLYNGYMKGVTKSTVAGPIADAVASKRGDRTGGMAGEFPRQMCVLAVTDDRLVMFKKKVFGSGCGKQMASMPRSDVSSAEYDPNDQGGYPGVVLEFVDGTYLAIFGEKRWNMAGIADALARD